MEGISSSEITDRENSGENNASFDTSQSQDFLGENSPADDNSGESIDLYGNSDETVDMSDELDTSQSQDFLGDDVYDSDDFASEKDGNKESEGQIKENAVSEENKPKESSEMQDFQEPLDLEVDSSKFYPEGDDSDSISPLNLDKREDITNGDEIKNSGVDQNKYSGCSKVETIDGKEYLYDSNGKLFRIGNELIPNNSYELNGYSYKTDEKGRVSSVEGQLHEKTHEGKLKIRDSIDAIGKGDQQEGDDRGHLIGDQFDGPNGMENMIPQDSEINQKDYKNFEDELRKHVKAGDEVKVKIEPIYEGDSRRPTDIVVTYSINGEENVRIFPNQSKKETE